MLYVIKDLDKLVFWEKGVGDVSDHIHFDVPRMKPVVIRISLGRVGNSDTTSE